MFSRNGNSKGIAYIEYENEKSASTAVMKMDEYEFMGRTLKVAISAPPSADERQNPPQQFQSNRNFPSTSTRPMIPRNEQKSRISFVPASVQKAASSDSAKPSSNMSNDDFRKMLMK